MNDVFFQELGIPTPDVRLNCGGGTHAEQTGKIMMAYEACVAEDKPACCLVVGDKLHFYVGGVSGREKAWHPDPSFVGLATLRRDGFASVAEAVGSE